MSGDQMEQFARIASLVETDVFDDLDSLARVRAKRPRPTSLPKTALSRLYVRMSWHELAEGMAALTMDHGCRLWLLLHWQTRVEKSKGGWLLPRTYMLEKLGLHGEHYSHVVARLERLGVVEVQRLGRGRSKKALLRLVKEGNRS
jgi:hypothetical protein